MKAEVKTKMQAFIGRDIDQHYHQGNRPIHITAIKAQAQTTKNLRAEKPQVWGPKPLLVS